MMGQQDEPQGKLFYHNIQLERRVRRDHPLRRVAELIDFDFVYAEVADRYGRNGNVSVPPPVILKLMLLLVLYNVRSERELMATLPERLDWLWFLGYDIDDEVPHHSVLSKARSRWGREVFRSFFERVVVQCAEAGLVDGSKLFMDSSLVEADASNDSIVDTTDLKQQLSTKYRQLEARLERAPSAREPGRYSTTNQHNISATDPDAALVRRGTSALRYQVHRAVDGRAEVVTATLTTPGDVNEAHKMMELVQAHESTTGAKVSTVVADSKYGTHENYLACHDAGLVAHIPRQGQGTDRRLRGRGLFTEEKFRFDAERDVYVCPAGSELQRRVFHKDRGNIEYAAKKKVCRACPLRDQCTRSKGGRTLIRHLRQVDLDAMIATSETTAAKRDLRRRQHLCEGSFALSVRHGYKRARWRRLWRVEIQELLTCTVLNIGRLLHAQQRRQVAEMALTKRSRGAGAFVPLDSRYRALQRALWSLFDGAIFAIRKMLEPVLASA